tara:strand:- start:348 stop:1460 length:1113 start_codon:yes stop_codon:yes gene_type:complete
MSITKVTDAGLNRSRIVTPIIINGDMSVAQRATSATGKTSDGYYFVDRWKSVITSLGTWTFSQSTTVPTGQGFGYSSKWDCTTADASPSAGDRIFFKQSIEGQNLQMLKKGTSSAESLTISFWVRSNKTGTYIVEIYDHDNSRHINKSYTISSADTWEKKTLTFDGDTTGTITNDNGQSLQISWWLGAGSTYTSGSLQTSWGSTTNANRAVGQVNLADSTDNEWYITGVQLEVGEFDTNTIPSFPFESFESNLRKCKRYLQYVCGNSNIGELTGGFRATGSAQCGVQFTTPMRAAPSVSLVGLRLHDLNDGDNLDVTSIGVVNGSSSNGTWLNMNNSGTGTVAGVCILYGYNASPTAGVQSYGIKVDAEL